jgi:hypothetical protein
VEGEEMAGDLRKLHADELHHLYFSPNDIRIFKSRKMKYEDERQ